MSRIDATIVNFFLSLKKIVSDGNTGSIKPGNQIQSPPIRYGIFDKAGIRQLFGCGNWNEFRCRHRDWVKSSPESNKMSRESVWTEFVAVGPKSFVSEFKAKLGVRAHYRRKEESGSGTWVLNDSIV